jgi:predicted CXXCH cytochrome family protein
MHGPARRNCGSCHAQGSPDEHRFYLVAPPEELCVRCHALPGRLTAHAPVREGACLSCHDPHGSEHKAALLANPNRDLCGRCHDRSLTTGAYVHGPVVLGACIVCHEPHASTERTLLRQSERAICLTCHEDVAVHDEAGWTAHGALEAGCVGCHDPHASEHAYQLEASAPELCLNCHEEAVEQSLAGAAVVHGAVMEEGGCVVCHEPHGSTLPSLRRRDEAAYCLECHDEPIQSTRGVMLTDMAALLAKNPEHHGPVREGVCTTCHQAHGGERHSLLVEAYPPEFYAPFELDTFKLCFQCHIPDLVLDPAGKGLTNFRDGATNLHWLHVNQEKGRTCRACHEVHASRRPAHVREAVPFGSAGWMLEINFQQTDQGGTCTPGCHTERKYTRGDQAPPPPPVTRGPGGDQ